MGKKRRTLNMNMMCLCGLATAVWSVLAVASLSAETGVFTPYKGFEQSTIGANSGNAQPSISKEKLAKILALRKGVAKSFNGVTNDIKMTTIRFSSEKQARQYVSSVDVGDYYYTPSGIRSLRRSTSRVLLLSKKKQSAAYRPMKLSANGIARLMTENVLKSTNSVSGWGDGQVVNMDALLDKTTSVNVNNIAQKKLSCSLDKDNTIKGLSECRTKFYNSEIKVDPVFVDVESGMMCTVEYELIICLDKDVDAKIFFGEDWGAVSQMLGTTDQFILSLDVETAEDVLLQAREWSKKDGVLWAEPNMRRERVKNKVLNDSYWSDLWHLKNSPSKGSVNAQDAWDTATGADIVIAIIDDGVDIAHEDLAANIYRNDGEIAGNGIDDDGNGYIDDVNGWNFVDDTKNANPIDADDAHGTSVAGMAAAVGNNGKGVAGAAYNAKILPIKIIRGSDWATDSAIASAIRYAAGLTGNGWRGADVLNCSWSGSSSSVESSAFSDAASRGRNGKGCPVFCASGNGASEWNLKYANLPAGNYTFIWVYSKDESDGSYCMPYDCAWVGGIYLGNQFPSPSSLTTLGDAEWTVCTGAERFGLGNGSVFTTFKSGEITHNQLSAIGYSGYFPGGLFSYYYRVAGEDNLDGSIVYDGLSLIIGEQEGEREVPSSAHGVQWGLELTTSYPAAYDSTIAVGASTSYDYRSPYSQYGSNLDLVAPSNGDQIDYDNDVYTEPLSTDRTGSNGYVSGNYCGFGGTSSASPLAAGVGALVLSKNPTLTAEEVRTILRKSCDKIGEYSYSGGISGCGGRNDIYGYGRINAKKALDNTPAASTPPPAAPVISSVTTTDSSCAKITWGAVTGATRYDLYRSTSSSRPSSAYKTNVTSPYSDTGATPGTTYYYWVAAVNSAGTSYSSPVSGKRAETLTVSSSSISAEASGKSGSISVTANCGWTVSKSVSWITVSPTSGSGNGSISYTVSANATSSSRSGTITVRSSGGISRTVSVSQAASSQGGGGSADEKLPNLAIAVFNDWEHGYGIFTTTNSSSGFGDPVRVFEVGERFDLVYGVGNFGEGSVDATIGFRVELESEVDGGIVYESEWDEDVTLGSMRGYSQGFSSLDWTNLVAGVYRASVTFDSYDELEEEDEEDNVGAIPFAIRDPLSLSEGLRCANLVFSVNESDWYGTYGDGPDGGAVCRTAHLGNDATNVLSTVVSGAGTVSFKWKVSSEAKFDKLDFVVDGVIVRSISGTDGGWQDVTYEIETTGQHRIEWRYGKDYSYFSGYDCAWLCNVAWVGSTPPPASPVISSVTTTDSSCAKITWGTVTGATRYDLYRSTSSSRPSSAYKTNVTSPYSDTGATPGTTYYYWVAAVNSAGTSYSSPVSGKRAETLSVSSSSISAEASGKSGSISVTANCGWTVSKSVSWITVSPTSGSGNGSISYTISANTTSFRSGTITVRSSGGISRTVSVSQEAAELPDLVIDAWEDWTHGYDIFTTEYPVANIRTCEPTRLFNKGTRFAFAYGVWNYGEGIADSMIAMQLAFESENNTDADPSTWHWNVDADWECMYGTIGSYSSESWRDLPPGVYLANLTVDSAYDLEEEDESNNSSFVPFAISDPVSLSDALENRKLTFSTSNGSWYGTRGDGPNGVTARTKHLGNDATNVLSTVVSGAGTVSFKWKVSSEAKFDRLDFVVDGVIVRSISGTDGGWQDVTYEIETTGQHRIEWRYGKDYSYFSGFDCAWLCNVKWEPAGPSWTIENGVLTDVDLNGEKNVTIPNGVWKIGNYAFGGDYLVESVTIPNTVTHIEDSAFSGCWNLSRVAIPDSVVSIGDYAFFDCRITQITIPKNVANIGAGAFCMCPISSFAVAGENANYKAVSGLLLSKDGTRLVAVPYKMRNVVIPSGVTKIEEAAAEAATCTNAVLPGTLAVIDSCAFSYSELKSISIPSSVKTIREYAFSDCYEMERLVLNEGITTIDEGAFCGTGVKSIRIPMSVVDIGDQAFAYCENLIEAMVPYLLKNQVNIGYVFEDCPISLRITYYAVVAFNANGGSVSPATRTQVHGAIVGSLPVPIRAGHNFLGWFTAVSGGTQVSTTTTITANATYYAHWAVKRYTVTFNANGGSGDTSKTVSHGSSIGSLPTPKREGYNFLGWYSSSSGGMRITDATKITSNTTYYAQWEPYRLATDIYGIVPEHGASVYDGYLYSGDAICGTIQAKVAKPKKGIAKVTAVVQVIGDKKVTIKGEMDTEYCFFENATKDGRWLWLEFGDDGLVGNFDGYYIDGVRNLFSSKDKSDKAEAGSAIKSWIGTLNMIWSDGIVSITVAKNGKVKIKGQMNVNGKDEKVSVQAQALIGDGYICIPVVYSKKSIQLTFVVWLPIDGGNAEIVGLSDAIIGHAGVLRSGARFMIDENASLWNNLSGEVLRECLPNAVPIVSDGRKWSLPKAGKVVYVKGTSDIDWTKAGDNPSALKLSYKAKDGSFKGSFKVYADVFGKPKPTSVTVSGIIIDGVGYGTATIKKVGSINVMIE